MGQVIGIDIGGTNLRLGCVSADGQLEHFERKSSAPMLKEGAVDVLCGEIMDYMERHSLKGAIDAVSVGVPSAVSKDKSFVYSTPNLKGLENIDLGHLLEKKLGIRVFVDRDVNYLCVMTSRNTIWTRSRIRPYWACILEPDSAMPSM